MRKNIVHPGAEELTYEIRGIVKVAKQLEALGQTITWENIGDPIAKGETVPQWIKDIVIEEVHQDRSWGYCPTKGMDGTRKFLADRVNQRGKIQITPDDILFFNGLGDAVSKIYGFLHPSARVIGPSPAYQTHSSAEGAHAGDDPITYNLDPDNGWLPDLDDLEKKIKYNPNVTGILIISPDNPTGMVYPIEYLEAIVGFAKKYNLFVMADEIYCNMIYSDVKTAPLSDLIGDVPGLALKGVSKEIPWPGARCGWIEVYNKNSDSAFATYVDSLEKAKMLEVCSTTLPQKALPVIYSDSRYMEHVKKRTENYRQRSEYAYNLFKDVPGVKCNLTRGSFYMSIILDSERLNSNQFLKIDNPEIKEKVEALCANAASDQRFVYYLLGATGICVVPMTSFCSRLPGFRVTLLEADKTKFEKTFNTLAEKIKEYITSA